MATSIFIFAAITFISTLIGGLIIFRFRKGLPYFFAFSAGSLMAVAFLDILPESLEIAQHVSLPFRSVMLTIVISFFVYSFLDKIFLTHDMKECGGHHSHISGPLGAGSLILHSFFDGAAIGAAFQVNYSTGFIVALAVIFHDFTDGINTVTLMLKNKQKPRKAFLFLLMDALAPALGIILFSFITFSPKALALLLAVFVGEFIYIGATSLLPETHKYPSFRIVTAMALGIILIAVLTSVIS